MVFGRKKDESGKSLLAPTSKKQRGSFFRRSSQTASGRSDNPGETKTGLDSAPRWNPVKAPKTPTTPPLTPDNEIYGRAPVSNVTVSKGGGGGGGTPHGKKNSIHLPKGRNSKKEAVADDRSEYSDLTDNRTLQRLNEQKVAYEHAVREKQQRDKLMQDTTSTSSKGSNPAKVLKEKTQREDLHQLVETIPEEEQEEAPRSLLSDLLGMMDSACKPSEPENIENVRSFAPEWGVAPTYDETDAHNKRPVGSFHSNNVPTASSSYDNNQANPHSATAQAAVSRGVGPGDGTIGTDSKGSNTAEDTRTLEGDEDDFTDTAPSQRSKSSSVRSPDAVHENFEMVLEELKEDYASPKRKGFFKNPFGNRGRRNSEGDEEEVRNEHKNSSRNKDKNTSPKSHKDLVKQTLFPDYDANGAKTSLKRSTSSKQQEGHSGSGANGMAKQGPPRSSFHEEKKEEVVDPVLDLPNTAPPPIVRKRSSKKGLFSSLRRSLRQNGPTLEPVSEDKEVTPREIRLDSTGARPDPRRFTRYARGGLGQEVVDNIYQDLQEDDHHRQKYTDSSQGSSTDYYTDRSSQDVSHEARLGFSGGTSTEQSSASGRLTPLVNEADSKEHDDQNKKENGFVGGFMAMITETVAAVHAGKPIPEEVKNIPEKQPQGRIRPSKSWKETTEDRNKEKLAAADSTPRDLRRTKSAPQKELASGEFKRRKQIWKEVKDPKTGRIYYYHRKTRQTTWTRPKEMDMLVEEEGNQATAQAEKENVVNQGKQPVAFNRKRSKSAEEKLAQLRQTRGAALSRQRSGNSNGKGSVRKQSARDFDPKVWEQKEEIARLLEQMAPPDGTSVESLMAQYEGRESELLAHVRNMKEARPFDEPIADDDDDEANEHNYEGGDDLREMNISLRHGGDASRASFPRTTSGITSKQSESTQQMGNGRNRPRGYSNSVGSSNKHGYHAQPLQARIPSKIPAPSHVRSRELMVEEFSQDRGFKSETYNNDVRGDYQQNARRRPFTTPYGQDTIEEEPADDLSSHANDTVSALSVNELEFTHPSSPHGMTEARRRALDDAILRQDWDMAAAISDGMKTIKRKQDSIRTSKSPHDWRQTELDKFITENDWEAVSEYIAHLRNQDERERAQSPESHGTGPPMARDAEHYESEPRSRRAKSPYAEFSDEDSRHKGKDGKMKKRFGAKSQLQHKKMVTMRSFSSESSSEEKSDVYTDDYSSESSSSEVQRKSRRPAARQPSNGRKERRPISSYRY